MTVATTLLGLLQREPAHGYELKRAYDERFAGGRPLAYGQVYATLARLLKHGLVEEAGSESGDGGPDRKRYAITDDGVADVDRWLATPEPPEAYLHSVLHNKLVLALLTGRAATEVVDVQRSAHLEQMRQLTARKMQGDLLDRMICDHALLHLEADLRWLELAAARLDELRTEVGA
ncbi:MAG: PadR family transcriptional regulator [Patulibacter minatonensis]